MNPQYRRSGPLWEGRHKGSLIDAESYALTCYRYSELNPVRASIVSAPGDYRWSSFRANAYGEGPDWLAPSPQHEGLGRTLAERQYAYRALFRASLDPEQVHEIRACCQTGTPLGNRRLKEQIERALDRSVGQSRRGRPGNGDETGRKGY